MGLIGGMARTAVVAGTATAVSNRVSRRQAGRWAAQEDAAYAQQQQAAPPQYQQQQYQQPAPAPAQDTGDMLEQLTKLGELRDAGVLTPLEFETQKARLLGG
jgi:Short C-terminal domain